MKWDRLLAGIVIGVMIQVGGPIPAGAAPAKPASKGKKGKKPKSTKTTPQEAAGQVLLAKSNDVQDCAGKHALDKGASSVDIDTKVTINSTGQVVNVVTVVKVDKGDMRPVKECVDGLIRSIKFPPIPAPLTTIERNWNISSG